MEEVLIARETKFNEEIEKLKNQYTQLQNQTGRKIHALVAELGEKRTLIDSLANEKSDILAKLDNKNEQLMAIL